MKYARASTATVALVLAGIIGCHPAPAPIKLPPPAPGFVVPAARADSSVELADRNAHLSADIGQFPGGNAIEHRTILVKTLGDLSKALQLANGPVESPEFINRIEAIESAKATASIDDLPRARMEAVENQALLAAAAALEEIRTRYLYDDEQLPPMLDALNADIAKANDTVGPLHDVDATHAFRSIENAMQRVTDDMTERFGNGSPPAGGAATPPPPPPAAP